MAEEAAASAERAAQVAREAARQATETARSLRGEVTGADRTAADARETESGARGRYHDAADEAWKKHAEDGR